MAETTDGQGDQGHDADGETRRDFLFLATGAMGAVGAGMAIWPLIDSMNPAGDVLALASIEVDLSPIEEGMAATFQWRGKPVFVRHRTAEEIERANDVDVRSLPDPQTDDDRVQDPAWMVLVGVCTHLGCVPNGQRETDVKGDFDGWFCPCHGSHYDISGRIRRGPAPTNLVVPPYEFIEDLRIRIG